MTADATQSTLIRGRVESVVRREAPALLAYFERRCPYAEAPDLLGETLLVAWRRADAMPGDDVEARMWLFGIARRVLGTSRRGRARRQALVDRLRDDALSSAPFAPARDDELNTALAALAPLDAEIIRLLHWDGFNLAEIARHLGRPSGTIRSRYSRACSALRLALQGGDL
ncbi:RNA polymerase sigma factor [Leifsonia sp. YAF41]|uniref:RNA polymerase sigma factor n=1 Tax=Leifsonia sp. YAF41 TaxID=3233086 RepID=UPI003F9D72C6